MTTNSELTLESQTMTHVRVGGTVHKREPWDPFAVGLRYGLLWMDESTPCNDCGVMAGQLHWPLCDQDYVQGIQLLGTVGFDDYLASPG